MRRLSSLFVASALLMGCVGGSKELTEKDRQRLAQYVSTQPPKDTVHKLESMVMGFKSVLAPVYGLAWGQRVVKPRRKPMDIVCPWRESSLELVEELAPIADVMAEHIEQASEYQRLTLELAQVRVPRIYLDPGLDVGATLFDALLDSDPSNNP